MKLLHENLPEALKEPLSPWRQSLAGALHRDRAKAHSTYLQVATIDSAGLPSNRTLVFRGFIADSNILAMVTDKRSAKLQCSDISHAHKKEIDPSINNSIGNASVQPAAIVWYLTESREQYRFTGSLIAIDDAHEDPIFLTIREALWNRLSTASQEPFWGPSPGAPLAEYPVKIAQKPEQTSALIPTDFVALMFYPESCDHLALRPTPQQRIKHWRDNDIWRHVPINP